MRFFLVAARIFPVVPDLAGVFFRVVAVAFLTVVLLALASVVPDFAAVVLLATAFVLFDCGFFLLSGLADAGLPYRFGASYRSRA